ncbi:Uncharacterised protein [Escherichia coli]|nr:Uncharacterised protein [Escherichia coli]
MVGMPPSGVVVLGDMQIIKIQTIRCTKAKSDRRGDAVTLIFDFVASGIVRFFAHHIQAHRGGITNDLIDVQRAAAEPGAANTGGGVNAGIMRGCLLIILIEPVGALRP